MSTLHRRSVSIRFANVREWHDEQGNLHRRAGPAIEAAHGSKYWWWHGKIVCRDLEFLFRDASIFPGYGPREE